MYWGGSNYLDANLMSSSGSGMQVSPGTTPNPDTHGSVWYVAADQCVHWMAFNGSVWLDANGYYTSRVGLVEDLGYKGNTMMASYPECVHEH